MGLGYGALFVPVVDADVYSTGLRADACIGYGFSSHFLLYGRIAGCLSDGLTPEGGVGIQTAWPFGPVTPALRLEIGDYWIFQPSISPGLIIGIGKAERLTLGVRTYFAPLNHWLTESPHPALPLDVFTAVHLSEGWSLFGGCELTSLFHNESSPYRPLFTFGLGYDFGFGPFN